jgi:hypothetical protein
MRFTSVFRAAVAVSLAGLLAACGGGGGGGGVPSGSGPGAAPAEVPSVAWASPAVFVTPGAASKSFELANCRRVTDSYPYVNGQYQGYQRGETDLYTASFVITSSGNVSVNAAVTSTGSVSSLWNFAFADAINSNWGASGTTQTPSFSLSGYTSSRGANSSFNMSSSADFGRASFNSYSRPADSSTNSYTDTYAYINCDMDTKLALQVNVDGARAAKNLGIAAGVNSFDDYDLPGRIESGKAFWRDSNALPEFSQLRFDLATGELASSSTTTGSYSPLSLTLPSGETEFGSYSESLSRNNSSFNFKDAKGICLNKSDSSNETGFSVSAYAYGNRFYPYSTNRFVGPSSERTAQQAKESSSCNNFFD